MSSAEPAIATQRQQSQVLLTTLEAQIAAVNQELATRAAADARVVRLRTHPGVGLQTALAVVQDRKSTRLNSSHGYISYAVFCLKKKKKEKTSTDATKKSLA